MNRLTKHEYLFRLEGATLEMFTDKRQLSLVEPYHWPLNSPDLNPVDFRIWELLEQNVYQGRRISDLDSLKEAIVEEWTKIPQEISVKSIYGFKPRLRRALELESRQVERYWLYNSHRYISICICKIWYDSDQLKKSYYNFREWVFFLPVLV